MTDIVKQMLERYDVKTVDEEKNALKEVIQEVVLAGLAKGGFFKEAAFYGGTALRIFYGLDRFSEDLDFSLLEQNPSYTLTKYFSMLSRVIESCGLDFTIEEKKKTIPTNEQTAFAKGNTREHLMKFYPPSASKVPYNELIKIKFEVDINPPGAFGCEFKLLLLPTPCKIRLYDLPSLFAGKILAILCRNWSRTKGRDLYDYLFYLSRNAGINMHHLKEKLVDSCSISGNEELSKERLVTLLSNKFRTIDYDQAREDVKPFIKNTEPIELWNADFFTSITHQYLFR